MYYHYALLLLFRPFINLRILKSNVVPHDICLQAADNISSLLQSYNRVYAIQNTHRLRINFPFRWFRFSLRT
jgi:hypothetical protein